MKAIRVLCITLIAGLFCNWTWSSGPSCSAVPPPQAVAQGYTVLLYCNSLFSNSVVDVNNTLLPGFLFYPTGYQYTLPANQITNDGTGIKLLSVPAVPDGGLWSASIDSAHWTTSGNQFSGAIYVELEASFDTTSCNSFAGSNEWEGIWLYYPIGALPSGKATSNANYTEIDIVEWARASGGIGCSAYGSVHAWRTGQLSYSCSNSNHESNFVPNVGFNKYGTLIEPSTLHSGTGTIQHWYNNQLYITTTYSAGAVPNPSTGSCINGDFLSADTEALTLAVQPGTNRPIKIRNLRIWVHP